jgi:putative DNA primase/helicase
MSSEETDKIAASAVNTARIRTEKKAVVGKEFLTKVIEASKQPTNGTKEIFTYDYTKGSLAFNRYSTMAAVNRVQQKYGKYICRLGDVVHAFDSDTHIWRPQKVSHELIADFVDVCTRDMIGEEEFRSTYSGDKLRPAIEKFQSNNFLTGAVNQTLNLKSIARLESKQFDANPHLFYARNGVVDILTGEIREAEALDYLFHRSTVTYNPAATCPRWAAFVSQIFADSDEPLEMVQFLKEVFGYSLTGHISAQKVFIHYGGGGNGKSTVLQALTLLMGDYSTLMNCAAFAKSNTAMSKELDRIGAKVEGKRVAIIDDIDSKTVWNEGTIKNLTGHKIIARRLYGEERDVPNRAKFHLGCNDVPVPQAENEAMLRRMCMIHYKVHFTATDSATRALQSMLDEEMSGIFNWSMEGYRAKWERGDFSIPKEVIASVEQYKKEQFHAENEIKKLLAIPSETDSPEDSRWKPMSEILAHINRGLENTGLSDRALNEDKLGRILKQMFNCEQKKIRIDGSAPTRVYKIKIITGNNMGLEPLK